MCNCRSNWVLATCLWPEELAIKSRPGALVLLPNSFFVLFFWPPLSPPVQSVIESPGTSYLAHFVFLASILWWSIGLADSTNP